MIKRIIQILIVLTLVVLVAIFIFDLKPGIHHSNPSTKPEAIIESNDKVMNAIVKSENFLKTYQEPDGFFEKGLTAPKPALTCLVLDAFLNSPSNHTKNTPFIEKALNAGLS